MQRFHQLLFTVSLLALSWYAMMAVHEFGHVVGALITGGTIERVVLHPFTISRTDVSPNPHPGAVVWLGPILGCLLPMILVHVLPARFAVAKTVAQFFAGFCLIANGTYISFGSIESVGDCFEMHGVGTPQWVMLAFGATTIPLGLYWWHYLGSLRHFLANPAIVTGRMAYVTFGILCVATAAGLAFTGR